MKLSISQKKSRDLKRQLTKESRSKSIEKEMDLNVNALESLEIPNDVKSPKNNKSKSSTNKSKSKSPAK